MDRVPKGSGQSADDFESELLPKRHGSDIGGYDMIELHGAEAALASAVE